MAKKIGLSLLVLSILFLTGALTVVFAGQQEDHDNRPGYERVTISGGGLHDFGSQIVHRSQETSSGNLEETTESIDLWGDLEGRVLYQPRSVYDFNKGTLVNTGNQVFSGTVKGSRPVMLFDNAFRFEIDLSTKAVRGKVYLTQHVAGPRISCELTVTDDGVRQSDKQPLFKYEGVCWTQKD